MPVSLIPPLKRAGPFSMVVEFSATPSDIEGEPARTRTDRQGLEHRHQDQATFGLRDIRTWTGAERTWKRSRKERSRDAPRWANDSG